MTRGMLCREPPVGIDLKKQGYEFVTIEQLIKMAGDAGDTGGRG